MRIYAGIATTALFVALVITVGTRVSLGAGRGRTTKLGDPADASGPLDIRGADLSQVRRRLVFRVRTAGPWGPDQLDPLLSFGDASSRFLCLSLTRVSSGAETRLCPGGSVAGQIGLFKIEVDGTIRSAQTINATVAQPQPNEAVVSLAPDEAGLVPGHYRWRLISQWSGSECQSATPSSCTDAAPDTGTVPFRLRPVGVVGCTRHGPELDFHGPSKRKAVALTFDDGPSDYTPSVLHTLRDKHAKGTFFEIGQEVAGHQHVMQSILASRDEIGNHTTHHSAFPGYGDLANTNHLIKGATGFTPCLFRPPNGSFNSGTLVAARQAHLKTIIWDVDPRDWSRPGSSAIYTRVVGATHSGAIIIMHDGGGNRTETVSALPRIIDNLRHHGYSFETVSQLLGDHMIFGPVG